MGHKDRYQTKHKTHKGKHIKFSNIFWGLLFLVAAGAIIASRFINLDISIFTILLTVGFGAGVIYHAFYCEWGGMFFCGGFLTWLYRAEIAEILDIDPFGIWHIILVAILLTIGFRLLFGRRRHKRGKGMFGGTSWVCDFGDDGNIHIGSDSSTTTENASGERVYFKEKFSGSSKYIHSENLSYVSIRNAFGGMDVHFENATLAEGGAVVEINNDFGGIELFIPRGWNVVCDTSSYFGGLETPNAPWIEGAPTLTLIGTNKFGGVEVRYV